MTEYIRKQDAVDALKAQADTMLTWVERYAEQRRGILTAVNIVEDIEPSTDVVKMVHGEWIYDGHHRRCNRCGTYFCNTDREGDTIPNNFCPNCGADMRGEQNG